MGRQSPVIVCIQNKADRDTLSKMNAAAMGGNGDPFYGAPCVAVVLVDKTIPTCVEDGSLVMGNMLNAAESVGLSACWIHRAKEMFETAEGQALLKKWGVPNAENLRGVGNCILGYAAEGGKKALPAQRKLCGACKVMQNEKKLVVLFPGFGYGPDKPLLYYAAKVARRQGVGLHGGAVQPAVPPRGNAAGQRRQKLPRRRAGRHDADSRRV